MRSRYLHISAYPCDDCTGPVVSGWFAVRETDLQRETDIRQVEQFACRAGIDKAK